MFACGSLSFIAPRFVLPVIPLFFLLLFAGCEKEGGGSYMHKGDGGRTGSKFFIPSEDDIVLDRASGLEFIKNVLNINFSPNADQKTIDKIIASINGEIVGYDYAVNFYQIRLKDMDANTLEEVRMKLLREYKEVEMASHTPVSAKENPYYAK